MRLSRISCDAPPRTISDLRASAALVVLGLWVSSLLPGHVPYVIPWPQVFAHLGYLNAFFGMPWLQMSYWSLAVEFQYYIFIGLCFPLLAYKGRIGPALILAIVALSALIPNNEALLPAYLPVFALGLLAFRHRCLKPRAYDTIAAVLVALVLVVWVNGWLQAWVGLATFLAILFVHVNNRVLNFFGAISYSLYLMHVFVGNLVFGLALRWAPRILVPKWSIQFIAVALAIGSAYLLYRLVELPSRTLAGRISYKASQ